MYNFLQKGILTHIRLRITVDQRSPARTDWRIGMQSILIFLETTVRRFFVAKLAFYNAKCMLHFATDRRFAIFNITIPVDSVVRYLRQSVGAPATLAFRVVCLIPPTHSSMITRNFPAWFSSCESCIPCPCYITSGADKIVPIKSEVP